MNFVNCLDGIYLNISKIISLGNDTDNFIDFDFIFLDNFFFLKSEKKIKINMIDDFFFKKKIKKILFDLYI
jgi:hypothetical protein